MLLACGCPFTREVTAGMSSATLVVDALLGTGLKGPAEGRALDLIRMMNSAFPMAARVSVDVPSGLHPKGESVAAALTVTFTAPKVDQVMPPTCDLVGDLIVVPIGTPPEIVDGDPANQPVPVGAGRRSARFSWHVRAGRTRANSATFWCSAAREAKGAPPRWQAWPR